MVRTRSATTLQSRLRAENEALRQQVQQMQADLHAKKSLVEEQAIDFTRCRLEVINHFTVRGGAACQACLTHRAVPVLPCTHMALCVACVVRVTECPVCRTCIDDVIVQTQSAFKAPLFYMAQNSARN